MKIRRKAQPTKQEPKEPIDLSFRRERSLALVFHSKRPRAVNRALVRLAVLYEDLRIELEGFDPPASLPRGFRVAYHRSYCLRRSICTMNEFAEVLRDLDGDKYFEQVKLKFAPNEAAQWRAAGEHFGRYYGKKGKTKLMTAIRNDLGGHFGNHAADRALAHLDAVSTGCLRGAGRKVYLEFALQLCVAALVHHVGPLAEFDQSFDRLMREVIMPSYDHATSVCALVTAYYFFPAFDAAESAYKLPAEK